MENIWNFFAQPTYMFWAFIIMGIAFAVFSIYLFTVNDDTLKDSKRDAGRTLAVAIVCFIIAFTKR